MIVNRHSQPRLLNVGRRWQDALTEYLSAFITTALEHF